MVFQEPSLSTLSSLGSGFLFSSGTFQCQHLCVSAAKMTPVQGAPASWPPLDLRKVLRVLEENGVGGWGSLTVGCLKGS